MILEYSTHVCPWKYFRLDDLVPDQFGSAGVECLWQWFEHKIGQVLRMKRYYSLRSNEISHSYKRVNEDLCGHADNRFWIMDGATGLSNYPLFHSDSDAYWLVKRYHEFFANNDPRDLPFDNYVKAAVLEVLSSVGGIDRLTGIDNYRLPSAGLFLGIVERRKLRFIQLGDCKCLLRAKGQLRVLGQSRLECLDRAVIMEMKQLHAAGLQNFSDVWAALLPLLRQNRAMANRQGGYWILGFDVEAIDNAILDEIDVNVGDSMIAMTDGFARLFEVFDLVQPHQMLSLSRTHGLSYLLRMLRQAEDQDPDCIRFARIKGHDDATAMVIDVID